MSVLFLKGRWSSSFLRLQRALCSQTRDLPVLTMFTKTKEPCSLCEDAKESLEEYKHRFTLEEVYIDAPGNEKWWEMYKHDIPVFHLNGEYLMRHRVNKSTLLKELDKHSNH